MCVVLSFQYKKDTLLVLASSVQPFVLTFILLQVLIPVISITVFQPKRKEKSLLLRSSGSAMLISIQAHKEKQKRGTHTSPAQGKRRGDFKDTAGDCSTSAALPVERP